VEINVGRLKRHPEEILDFSFAVAPGEPAAGDLRLHSPLHVDGTVTNAGRSLLVRGNLAGEITLECSRCLEEFAFPLRVHFEQEFRPQSAGSPGFDDDFMTYNDDVLDLDDLIQQTVWLNLPMKPLCRPDCLGLCPVCGHNLNEGPCSCTPAVDPRWAPLADVKAHLPHPGQ